MVKEELLNILLMQMNYVPKHFRDHADSEYVAYMGVDCKIFEFIGNKHIDTQLHIVHAYLHLTVDTSKLHINI